MVFNGVSKGMNDPVVEQMVDKATKVLEAIADKSWVPWVERLIPNISHRFRVEAEVRAQAELDHKLQEEVQRIVKEKLARVARWDKRLEEKVMEVLEGWLTQVALEVDSEAEEMGEAEGSEAVRMEDFGMIGGTQSSAMEVDEEGEDKVVVVEGVKQSKTRKQAPSLPPKMSRKRV